MEILFSARCVTAAVRLRAIFVAITTLVTASSACSQAPQHHIASALELTVSEAYRLSFSSKPWEVSRDERTREQVARASVADSWLADQPTISSGLRVGNLDGLREYEIEISAPIATVKRRALQVDSAQREAAVQRAGVEVQRLRLAGEVRDAFWAVQLAATELRLARDEVARATALATDSARRAEAGDIARVDTLHAQIAVQLVTSSAIETEARLEASRQVLRSLVGDAALRPLSEQPEQQASIHHAGMDLREHPALVLAAASVASARAKLNEAPHASNAAPSLSFTLTNERASHTASATTARIGISIPFGRAARATPRVAQASAELIEAQASEPLAQRQLRTELDSAQRTFAAIEKRIDALTERARLAVEVSELYAKAYRLGELDLPTRLRAEGERANAALALARARIEHRHAISRVNQSLGILP
jgi:outer membrane protein, heavy metal efflux system